MEITRRNALKIIGATPVAAGLGLADGQAAQTPAHAGHVMAAGHQVAAAAKCDRPEAIWKYHNCEFGFGGASVYRRGD